MNNTLFKILPNFKKVNNKFLVHLSKKWVGFQGNFKFLYFFQPKNLYFFITKNQCYLVIKDSIKTNLFIEKFIYNTFIGVTLGHSIKLRVVGVGFKIEHDKKKDFFILKLGFSHEVIIKNLKGLQFKRLNERSSIYIFNFYNKRELLNFLTRLKKYRPLEPYKGKGLRYTNEKFLRKEGKKSNL